MNSKEFFFTEVDSLECKKAVEDLRDLQERGIQSEIRVVLTEHGNLNISAHRCNAGTPERQWHGVDQAFVLQAQNAKFLEKFLSLKEFQKLLQRLHSGHEVKWDGHNHVGVLDDDAQEVFEALELMFDVYETMDRSTGRISGNLNTKQLVTAKTEPASSNSLFQARIVRAYIVDADAFSIN